VGAERCVARDGTQDRNSTVRRRRAASRVLSSTTSSVTLRPSVHVPEPRIAIARARRDELPAVQRLAGIIWRAHYPGIITHAQIEYMLERGYSLAALETFLGAADRGLELARVDGELAGFAAWYLTDDRSEAKLDKLYVLQSQQRRGLGGLLISRACELARAAGARVLILNVNKNNAQAIRAYGKRGFALREAVVVDIGGGFVMDDYVMAKPL
jgi:ribosomal protein S18 acetylase RimI-like enzyme